MKPRIMTCRHCKTKFEWDGQPKAGFVDECGCKVTEEEELVGGNMIYTGKTGPELELKPLSKAKVFAFCSKRYGASITKTLITQRENRTGYDTSSIAKNRGRRSTKKELKGEL